MNMLESLFTFFFRQSSFCFYELDIHYTNIANKTTLNQDKHKENFLSEKMEEGSLAMNGHERNMSQFQIKITKTLDYLWEVKLQFIQVLISLSRMKRHEELILGLLSL